MRHVEEVRQIDDTHLHWKAKVARREQKWEAVITEQIPDERLAWKSTQGSENAGVVTFHPIGDMRTRVILQLLTDSDGVIETVGEAVGVSKRAANSDLERYKEFIEAEGV